MKRSDKRSHDELRPVSIERNYLKFAEGAVLIAMGDTKILCTATVEERVPPFLQGGSSGWITAEYSMLPRSSHTRIPRERTRTGGRTHEIQRLIGRSLRAVTDLDRLGKRTIYLDCDVIQADGGTRTASITGAYVALADTLAGLKESGLIETIPLLNPVAAVSVGIVEGTALLDLSYEEDFAAEVDMNVVMTGDDRFVEVQGTAEENPFTGQDMDKLISLARAGIKKLAAIQESALKELVVEDG